MEGDDGLRQLSEIQLQERGDGVHVRVTAETEEAEGEDRFAQEVYVGKLGSVSKQRRTLATVRRAVLQQKRDRAQRQQQ